ncbi:MAG: electron transfer flavoprotein subunit alpha/FixB family protein, partial [Geobacteraceae bacterium]|nr:electron transfer flavoprotein subunit alpha/FixB family protein [Geobacteraceae bacterium]
MSSTEKILVFVDLAEGLLDETGRGLLSYGSRLAGILDAAWGAVIPGEPAADQLAGFGAYGAPAVTRVVGGESLRDTPALLGKTLALLATEQRAGVIVLPHNDLGATLAPVIAVALNAAIITEVATARRGPEGLRLSRPALGGRVAETKVWDG